MFAGPNGSGKSELKSLLSPELLGVYLNADDIEKGINSTGMLDMHQYHVEATEAELHAFFKESELLSSRGLNLQIEALSVFEGRLIFTGADFNSYLSSVLVSFLRMKLLASGISFTFETVMSHPEKVQILEDAHNIGYRTYLYYVATDDPAINVSRVKNRVKLNGHDVPPHLVEKRYYRSLDLLIAAIRQTNRAFIFDNSTDNVEKQHTWLAEVTDGTLLEIKTDRIPAWFKRAVLDKIS